MGERWAEGAGVDGGVDAGRPKGEDPPQGYTLAVEQPVTSLPSLRRTGVAPAMVLDQNDQPLIAYLHEDPDGDGQTLDTRVEFTRWNGLDKKWQTARVIEVTGLLDVAAPHRPLAIARDSVTGRLAISYPKSDGKLQLAQSDDEGENWSITSKGGTGATGRNDVALGLRNGATSLAWVEDGTTIRWESPSGTNSVSGLTAAGPLALAIDSAGKPGLAYFASSTGGVELSFRRLDGAATVIDSSTDSPSRSVALAFAQDRPRLTWHTKGATGDPLWKFAAASDASGSSFGASVMLPPNVAGEVTESYSAIAIDSAGKVALGANFARYTSLAPYGGPKIATSADGTTFVVTSPDKARALGEAGHWIALGYSKTNKLTVLFRYPNAFNPNLGNKAGLVHWRE
jgi:hypothetical protein